MSENQFDGALSKTAFLMDTIPQTRRDYLYLILSYWQVFDGIELPDEVVKDIIGKATQPETINRARRKAMEQLRMKQYLELQRMAKELDTVEAPNQT